MKKTVKGTESISAFLLQKIQTNNKNTYMKY